MSEEKVKEIQNVIASINATSDVTLTMRCRVDVKHLLNRRAYSSEAASALETTPADTDCLHKHTETHGHNTHQKNRATEHGGGQTHQPQVGTVSLSVSRPLDRDK